MTTETSKIVLIGVDICFGIFGFGAGEIVSLLVGPSLYFYVFFAYFPTDLYVMFFTESNNSAIVTDASRYII